MEYIDELNSTTEIFPAMWNWKPPPLPKHLVIHVKCDECNEDARLICYCTEGCQGNPYVAYGCQGEASATINYLLFLLILSQYVYFF